MAKRRRMSKAEKREYVERKAAECNEVLRDEAVVADGIDFGADIVEALPTCAKCGAAEDAAEAVEVGREVAEAKRTSSGAVSSAYRRGWDSAFGRN